MTNMSFTMFAIDCNPQERETFLLVNFITFEARNAFGVAGFLIKTTFGFTDLDQGSEMIIFESILTTFKASVIFRGQSCKNWLGLKTEQPLANLACQIGETHTE
jgi:hypothetical protein